MYTVWQHRRADKKENNNNKRRWATASSYHEQTCSYFARHSVTLQIRTHKWATVGDKARRKIMSDVPDNFL